MRTGFVTAAAACLLLSGCGGEPKAGDGDKPQVPSVSVKNFGELDGMIAAHRGNVVVVDLWAIWWDHCVKGLPYLLQLQEDYENVVVMSMNLDHNDPDSPPTEKLKKEVLELLVKNKITCENVISAEGHDRVVANFGVENGIPAVLIYNKEGKLHKAQDADSIEEDVLPVVKELLGQ